MKAKKMKAAKALDLFHLVVSDIERCVMLGKIAAEYGNGHRAAWYLTSALADLAPELRTLRAEARP